MLVQCIENRFSDEKVPSVAKEVIRESFGSYQQYPLTKGSYYVVYGIETRSSIPWYYVSDGNYNQSDHFYPLAYPYCFFFVKDDRPSSCWVKGKRASEESITSFKEWVEEEAFFEGLVNGEDREGQIFRKYKDLMDLEYAIPSVRDQVQILDDDWLMCPQCDEVWQNNSSLEMILCPKCQSIYLNDKSGSAKKGQGKVS
jgi:Zn-finger nucleic acid-binding protein